MIDALAAAAALLLVVSGIAKLGHPGAAAAMVLRLVRLTGPAVRSARDRRRAASLVRVVGLGEVGVGVAVVATGSRAAIVLLATAYLLFAAVAATLLRAGDARTSCGCFGSTHSPLGPAHLVLDLVAAATAVTAAFRPPGPGLGLWDGGPATAVIGSVQAVLLAALGYLAITSFPALLAARRPLVPATPTPSPRESR